MTVIEHLKRDLEYSKKLILVDYSENYQYQMQNEIQSAYFGHKSVSLFTACAYFRSIDDNEVKSLPITITTEGCDKSQVASLYCCINKIISHVESLIGNVVENVHIFSDGMSSQFHPRFVFHFLTKIQLERSITWYYNERGHEKGPMDGIEGTLKNLVFKEGKSGHCITETLLKFAQYPNEICESITSLYMCADHLLE